MTGGLDSDLMLVSWLSGRGEQMFANTAPSWLLVYSQPNREFTAASFLKQFDFTVYFPRIRHKSKENGCPFLNRYLFAQSGTGRRDLEFIPGVARFVRNSSQEPILVRQAVIDRLRAREDKEGFVQLDGELLHASRGFRKGDRVRVVDNDGFDMWDALFERMTSAQRAEVFAGLLGKTEFYHRLIVPLARIRRFE